MKDRRHDRRALRRRLRGRFSAHRRRRTPEKTRLIEFGRFAFANRERRGDGKPETFSFLGFTHIWAKGSERETGVQADLCAQEDRGQTGRPQDQARETHLRRNARRRNVASEGRDRTLPILRCARELCRDGRLPATAHIHVVPETAATEPKDPDDLHPYAGVS